MHIIPHFPNFVKYITLFSIKPKDKYPLPYEWQIIQNKKSHLTIGFLIGFRVRNRCHLFVFAVLILRYFYLLCEIIYFVNCEIWNYRFKWNEINPRAAKHISRCLGNISHAKCISQIRQDLFRWKNDLPKASRFFCERSYILIEFH